MVGTEAGGACCAKRGAAKRHRASATRWIDIWSSFLNRARSLTLPSFQERGEGVPLAVDSLAAVRPYDEDDSDDLDRTLSMRRLPEPPSAFVDKRGQDRRQSHARIFF